MFVFLFMAFNRRRPVSNPQTAAGGFCRNRSDYFHRCSCECRYAFWVGNHSSSALWRTWSPWRRMGPHFFILQLVLGRRHPLSVPDSSKAEGMAGGGLASCYRSDASRQFLVHPDECRVRAFVGAAH